MTMDNLELLDQLIMGRIKPHIYAFSTNTIPNCLKIGDTYRPVAVRLMEWKHKFPNLKKEFEHTAAITDDIFFRDYSVHQYLENDLNKERLQKCELPNNIPYSKEFFKGTFIKDVSAAIDDIEDNYKNKTGKYKFYDANNKLPETYMYASAGEWKPRPIQKETIDNFIHAINSGRTNLLMYAVMRFGKSFTALCCAKAMQAKFVLVVSAKADVREEWKKTVESADNFNKEYVFLSSESLKRDSSIINTAITSGNGAVVFLTLQDLQGETIKDKHKELFNRQIDLLIVDETHFGARAESYGKVIRTAGYEGDVKDRYSSEDFIEIADAEEQLKQLSVKITLHLSGTPYRILMGSEFSKEDVIAFYQFSDIIREQEQWDRENFLSDDKQEWENPYYGFPQMIRFAFTPSKSALNLLDSLKSSGTTYAFSALLKPVSISKDTIKSGHKKFVYEEAVLELFEVIDGSKNDEGLLSFLDYDKIKEGKMCRHIVCVLPYCASCDALENLILSNKNRFKNLQEYVIINISGVDAPKTYKSTRAVKNKVSQCEKERKKTLTLTVNRMLTGSTVEQWDTMIFLKDTASAQEYDQAIFRIQNQYIREYIDKNGDTIKYNMKPQTLLVDFDPHRMFRMQEQKSLIYNANTNAAGNQCLKERMAEELKISPIITLNKNRIQQVDANDILSVISEYSSNRGVMEEAQEIPIDMALLDIAEIKREIENQAEAGSKQGLAIEAYSGNESDFDKPDNGSEIEIGSKDVEDDEIEKNTQNASNFPESEKQIIQNKFRTYYSRILFFAFLTKNTVESLDAILACIDDGENPRIACHLQLNKYILQLMKEHMNIFVLHQLDYKIQNINTLAQDTSIAPMQKAITAIHKFGRISESEITTPQNIAKEMVSLIPDECFQGLKEKGNCFLDIASKMGEFAIAVFGRCSQLQMDIADLRGKIRSIPTSPIAYEFTRKIYEVIGLDVESIASEFNSYDLLNIKKVDNAGNVTNEMDYEKIKTVLSQNKSMAEMRFTEKVIANEGDKVKFNAIVGNPPYQEGDGGAGASSRALYPYFVDISRALNPDYASIIMPTRWYAGGKHLDEFRKTMLSDKHIKELHDCIHPEDIFPDTNNRGGICYLLWDRKYDNTSTQKTKIVTHGGEGNISEANRSLQTRDLDIFIRNSSAIDILDKVIPDEKTDTMSKHISARKPFGIESNIIKSSAWSTTEDEKTDKIICYGKGMKLGYVKKELITSNEDFINVWKVYTPRANNVGTELKDDNLNTFVGKPGTICTEAYLVIGGDLKLTKESAENLAKYFNTKFVRFMHSLAKSSHDASRATYRFVPVVDFSREWVDKELYEKYGLTQSEIELIEKSIKPM